MQKGVGWVSIVTINYLQLWEDLLPERTHPHATMQTRLKPETADNLVWACFVTPTEGTPPPPSVIFEEISTPLL